MTPNMGNYEAINHPETATREDLAAVGVTYNESFGQRHIIVPHHFFDRRGPGIPTKLLDTILRKFGFDPDGRMEHRSTSSLGFEFSQGMRGLVPRRTNIVGFVGRKRAGKDTAALALTLRDYVAVKFAGPLKLMLATFFEYAEMDRRLIAELIEGAMKETPVKVLGDKSARYAMQTLGTEWGRDLISPNIWVNACLARCQREELAVVTDVRFPNEVEALRGIGATIIRITRGADTPLGATHLHVSETDVDTLPVDFELANDGTVAALHDKVLKCLNI